MFRALIAVLLIMFPIVAEGGEMLLKDLKEQNGVRLSKNELEQLMPNARIVNHFGVSTRHWTNEANGSFTAYSNAANRMKSMQTQAMQFN